MADYVEVWTNSHFFPQWIANSNLPCGLPPDRYIAICSAAGYAFARNELPRRDPVIFIADTREHQ